MRTLSGSMTTCLILKLLQPVLVYLGVCPVFPRLHACSDVQGSAEAELAYARLEALCQAVKVELQQDLHIHDAAVLPNFVNLPKIAAAEYGRVSTDGVVCPFACQ